MVHLSEFIGKRFGSLTITDFAGWKHSDLMFHCICDCGEKSIRSYEGLKRNSSCINGFYCNINKFMSKIKKIEGCWIWKLSYRFVKHKDKRVHVAQVLYFYSKKIFTHDKYRCIKKCRTKNCVNPDHFEFKLASKNQEK